MSNTDIKASESIFTPAGLLRRVAAMTYDSMLVIALFVIPTSIVMALRGGEPIPPGSILFQALLIVAAGVFFVGFWTTGGQTLGMRAWRIRVVNRAGQTITFRQSLIRFITAIPSVSLFGIGIFWLFLDPQKRTLPDRIAGTRVIVLPKTRKNPPGSKS
jgi:uncharacterized RDD family membrane protein YckC